VEWRVGSLIVIVLVVWVGLSLLLAAWTLFFQGYIYSEPVSAIYWRAPAAGTALTVFVILWMMLDYRSVQDRGDEGRYQPLHSFSYRESERYEHLWIIRDGIKEHYEWRGNQYVNKSNRRLPERPRKIIASHKADGDEHDFEPKLDAKGNFQIEADQKLRYYEKDNPSRYMEEGYPGLISITHFGWLVMNLLLNFGFLAVWFVSLWLLLRFQWSHALGLAVVFWLVMLLFIMPMILKKTEEVRKERLPPKTTPTAGPTAPSDSSAVMSWRAGRVSDRSASGTNVPHGGKQSLFRSRRSLLLFLDSLPQTEEAARIHTTDLRDQVGAIG
jgi:hypothetical protein